MQADELLRKVAVREWIRRFAVRFATGLMAAAGIYLTALVVQRTTNLFPDIFADWMLTLIPAVALLFALMLARKPARSQAARMIDRLPNGERDLFLSFTTLETSEGEYRAIVKEKARAAATAVSPAQVVPFHWVHGALRMTVAGLVVIAALQLLPQLDPFKKTALRDRNDQQQDRLVELKKITALRKAQLASDHRDKAIAEALTELEKTFRIAKPEMRQANLEKLEDHQKRVGEFWRQLSKEKLKKAMDMESGRQKFGALDTDETRKLEEQLRKGDFSGAKQALAKMKKEAGELARTPDSQAKRGRQVALRKQLQSLADAAANALNSKPLTEALSRALEQLDLARSEKTSTSAMAGMEQSLDLSQEELESLAQSLNDLKDLEDALRSLQAAKQLNAGGKLDGKAAAQCDTIGEYAALYESLLAQQRGAGPGMKGPGTGKGGKAPEDKLQETDFKTEQTKGLLAGGKLLLEWKTNEVSEAGEAAVDYVGSIEDMKEGVGEAILQEQVPPGYHEGIQRYFDSIQPPVQE